MITQNDKLYGERMAIIQKLRALDSDIGEGAISGEQRHQIDKHNAAITDLDKQIQRNISNAQAAESSARLEALTGGYGDSRRSTNGNAGVLAELLGAGSRGESRSIEFTAQGAVNEQRAILTTTSGAVVETDYVAELMAALTNGAPVWEASRRIVTDHSRSLEFPAMTSGAAAAVAENGAIGASDPVISTLTLDFWKYAQSMTVSREAEHAVIEALNIVATDMVVNVGTAAETQFVLGDGSSEPLGLANAGYSAFNLGGLIAPTGDELISALHSVSPQYRRAGRMHWILNDATIASIRSLKSSDGVYLWQGSLTGAEPDRLLGYPVIASSDVAAVGANAKSGYFVDMDRFIVRETPIRLERSDSYAFLNDASTWRCIVGVDSICTDTASGVVLTNAAS